MSEDPLHGLTTAEAEQLLKEFGPNEIPEKITPVWWLFVKQFVGTMPFMIEIAAILAASVQKWDDFAIIMILLCVNGSLGFYEESKAQQSVDALRGKLVHRVNTKRDGEFSMVDSSMIVPGDIIFLKGGQVVPADCEYVEGDVLQVDTSALTGEPFPRKVPNGDKKELLSGCMVKQGEAYCIVQKTGLKTVMGEAAELMQDATPEQGQFEAKVIRVCEIVIGITLVIVIIMVLEQILYEGDDVSDVLVMALSIVIASVPVALPMVIQITLALGAKKLADQQAIVTHLTALQDIASMTVLCSDKTGTLTTANIQIQYDAIYSSPGFTKDEVLLWATVCSNVHNKDDPIDGAVFKSYRQRFGENATNLQDYRITKFVGFNPTVKRTIVYCSHGLGDMRISKGLVDKVMNTGDDGGETWIVDKYDEIVSEVHRVDKDMGHQGYKTLGVSVSINGGPMRFVGILPMIDPPRHDTAEVIASIQDSNVRVKMITGDHQNIAVTTADMIGIGKNILPASELAIANAERDEKIRTCDGFAQVLPKDKREVVLVLQQQGEVVGMTGDGVNDAPALAQANIGIAVDGATDAARSAADIILTESGLGPIHTAIMESRCIFKRLRSYVLYRLSATVQIVSLLSIFIFFCDQELDALYIILLALFNDITMLMIAYDNAEPSPTPETATISDLLLMSFILGTAEMLASLAFYGIGFYAASSGWDEDSYRQSVIYLQISVAIEMLIFNCRTDHWFFLSQPYYGLTASVAVANILVTICCATGFIVTQIDASDIALAWSYNIIVLFAIDLLKLICLSYMKKFNYAEFMYRHCCWCCFRSLVTDDEQQPLVDKFGDQEVRQTFHAKRRNQKVELEPLRDVGYIFATDLLRIVSGGINKKQERKSPVSQRKYI